MDNQKDVIEKNKKKISYRNLHEGIGHDYAYEFINNPYRSMMWRLEQKVLDALLDKYLLSAKPVAMDFACGTGRVLQFISKRVDFVVGIDVAGSMLKVAAESLPINAELINNDITLNSNVFEGKIFDVITAFRFFPNAEDSLRDQAMQKLAEHLKPKGIMIFNNHQNASSPVRSAGAFLGMAKAKNMKRNEVYALANRNSLEIIEEIGLGVLPFYERFMPISSGLVETIEWRLGKLKLSKWLGRNVIYVAHKIN